MNHGLDVDPWAWSIQLREAEELALPDEIYDHLIRLMQDTLDTLAQERRLPVIG